MFKIHFWGAGGNFHPTPALLLQWGHATAAESQSDLSWILCKAPGAEGNVGTESGMEQQLGCAGGTRYCGSY